MHHVCIDYEERNHERFKIVLFREAFRSQGGGHREVGQIIFPYSYYIQHECVRV